MPKITELTPQDLQKLKNKTPLSLPDNPSSKGFSASQIKEKMSGGCIYLFEKLQTTIKELNDYIDSNDVDIITINSQIESINSQLVVINNFIVSLNTDVDKNTSDITKLNDEITTINTSLAQLKEKIDGIVFPEDCATISYVDTQISNLDSLKENVSNKTTSLTSSSTHRQYPSAKVVYDNIQNVLEVAEGKNKSYVISYSDEITEETDFSLTNYYDMNGYRIENYGEVEKYILVSALESPSANNDFNSKNDNLVFEDLNRYIVVETSSVFNNVDINGKVILPLEYFISKLKIGDVINIREVNIPDRWYAGNHSFGALETKIDLTELVNISDDQEINGIKTFNNDIQVRSNIVGVGSDAKNIGEENLPFDHLYVKYISDGTNEWTPGDFATKSDISEAVNELKETIDDYPYNYCYINDILNYKDDNNSKKVERRTVRLTNAEPYIKKDDYYQNYTKVEQGTIFKAVSYYFYAYKEPSKTSWVVGYNGGLGRSTSWETSITISGDLSYDAILFTVLKRVKINGAGIFGRQQSLFIPTSSGTKGQVLVSNGPHQFGTYDNPPTWSSDFYTKTEVDNAIQNAIGNVLNGDF